MAEDDYKGPEPDINNELPQQYRPMRVDAQEWFRSGVEGMVSEVRRFAASAERAIGEISIDEAYLAVARVVVERVAMLTGKTHEEVIAWIVDQLPKDQRS